MRGRGAVREVVHLVSIFSSRRRTPIDPHLQRNLPVPTPNHCSAPPKGYEDIETPTGVFRIHALGFQAGDTALYRFTGSVVHTLNGGPTFLSSSACHVTPDTWYNITELYAHEAGGGHCTRWPQEMTDDVANERKDAATEAGFTR